MAAVCGIGEQRSTRSRLTLGTGYRVEVTDTPGSTSADRSATRLTDKTAVGAVLKVTGALVSAAVTCEAADIEGR
jgi:hypothetical protein